MKKRRRKEKGVSIEKTEPRAAKCVCVCWRSKSGCRRFGVTMGKTILKERWFSPHTKVVACLQLKQRRSTQFFFYFVLSVWNAIGW